MTLASNEQTQSRATGAVAWGADARPECLCSDHPKRVTAPRCRESRRLRRDPTPPSPGNTLAPGSEARLGGEPSRLNRLLERLVVAFVLLGVGVGELDDRPVEGRPFAEIGGNRHAVAAAGMSASKSPSARASVARHPLWHH